MCAQPSDDTGVYVDLAALIALEHRGHKVSFLARQPVHSLLSGRFASRMRGRGLNFEEIRDYRPGDDVRSIALNVVNPNAQIREGYEMFVATTTDGAVHSGFLVTQDKDRVVLRDMAGVSASLARGQVAALKSAGRSLMPDGLLAGRSDEELRDLFAYLRINQPLVIRK